MHTSRCSNAKNPECHCSCQGKMHHTTRRQKERLKKIVTTVGQPVSIKISGFPANEKVNLYIEPTLESFEQ